MVESKREIGDRIECETRFHITSLGPMIRDHWSIENSLRWFMDMTLREDKCRIKTENASTNFTTLKPMARNLICKAPGEDSLRLQRKTAAWDDDFLETPSQLEPFTRFPRLGELVSGSPRTRATLAVGAHCVDCRSSSHVGS